MLDILLGTSCSWKAKTLFSYFISIVTVAVKVQCFQNQVESEEKTKIGIKPMNTETPQKTWSRIGWPVTNLYI